MAMPFPGMDPYLEHPILWEGFHPRLIIAIANQLQPRLDPRYIASIEERVFIEAPQHRNPDVRIEQRSEAGSAPIAVADADAAVILEAVEIELRQRRVEILDAYNEMKLVAVIELLSPTNKVGGAGRQSYEEKQHELLDRNCHFIEIDLLRKGTPVIAVPERQWHEIPLHDYLVCVHRWPRRRRFELYPRQLRQRLPRVAIPLVAPDADVTLDLQAAVEQVYQDGRYHWRIKYHEPCVPPLSAEDQAWADEEIRRFREQSKNGLADGQPPT